MKKKNEKKFYINTKLELFSRIKARLRNRKAKLEMSGDLEKVNLAPEELILIEYIDLKISQSKR